MACLSHRGSSPLTRGKRVYHGRRAGSFRLIPAHAGKTRTVDCGRGDSRAHPRSRGENRRSAPRDHHPQGSSPLTRGKPTGGQRMPGRSRLIPAHAGKTRASTRRTARSAAHPRSRGENERASGDHHATVGSSPLTRGKPHADGERRRSRRLIPAHAGKTSTRGAAQTRCPAHPRSRGENRSRPAM